MNLRSYLLWIAIVTLLLLSAIVGCDGHSSLPSKPRGASEDSLSFAGGGGDGSKPSSFGGMGGVEVEPEEGVCSGIVCEGNRTCVAEGNFAVCACRPGFSGADCFDEDECQTPEICGSTALCVNVPGSYLCECKSGYRLVDGACVDTDECMRSVSPCDANATCENVPGGFLCNCAPGTFGDGTFCKAKDDCASEPCGLGVCHNSPEGFSCECPLGRSGAHCEAACPLGEPIVFESAILENAVAMAVGKPGPVTPADLVGVVELLVPLPDGDLLTDDEVRSLSGLECWPTLERLNLRGHNVTNIEALRSLGSLRELDLGCSHPTSLDAFQQLSRLRSLTFENNALCVDHSRVNLSLSPLSNLRSLETMNLAGFSFLNDLTPLSSLKRLRALDLQFSNLTEVSSLSSVAGLESLNLSRNSGVSLSGLEGLEGLRSAAFAYCELTTFAPPGQWKHLESLELSGNPKLTLESLSLPSLRRVEARSCELESLESFATLPSLAYADLRDNQLQNISELSDLGSTTKSFWLLQENPLDCSEWFELTRVMGANGLTAQSDCR